MTEFFIGVDGGGTGCRAVVAGRDGTILGFGHSGSANIVTDPQTSLVNVKAAIDNAFDEAGLDKAHYATSHAVLGL
ncbi:BadF/BadG/BcrA/BcrD ATPase family protein, partial [Brucella abortus]